jgi:hypothetical protein
MKQLLWFSIVLSFLFMGCVPLVKLHYGITEPKPETSESLIKFLRKHHYPVTNFYIFKDSTGYLSMLRNPVFKKNLLTTMIIDKDFHKITIDTVHCQWSGGYFVNRLKKDTIYQLEPLLDVEKLLSMLILFPDSSIKIPVKGEFDFLVINTWGKFIGKVNERLFATIPAAENRKDLRIIIVNLNIDLQKSWKLTKDQMIRFK